MESPLLPSPRCLISSTTSSAAFSISRTTRATRSAHAAAVQAGRDSLRDHRRGDAYKRRVNAAGRQVVARPPAQTLTPPCTRHPSDKLDAAE